MCAHHKMKHEIIDLASLLFSRHWALLLFRSQPLWKWWCINLENNFIIVIYGKTMNEYYAIYIRNHLVFSSFPILNNFKYVDIEDKKSTQHDWGISLQFCLAISFQIRILFLVSYIAKSELAGYRKKIQLGKTHHEVVFE